MFKFKSAFALALVLGTVTGSISVSATVTVNLNGDNNPAFIEDEDNGDDTRGAVDETNDYRDFLSQTPRYKASKRKIETEEEKDLKKQKNDRFIAKWRARFNGYDNDENQDPNIPAQQ